jgi:CRISPR-associated exonuclease Cas4
MRGLINQTPHFGTVFFCYNKSIMLKKSKRKSRIKKQDMIDIINDKTVVPVKHPEIAGVTVIGDKNTFPVSWLQKQEYCEYQVYLEHFKKIKARPTIEMITGSIEHHRLEAEFKEKAEPATFEEMVELSYNTEVYSRELPVVSFEYGIHGLIDEIRMSPEEFIIIDDKPGTKMYLSNLYQVYGYCLAFKEMIRGENDNRTIYAALRERGTDNIYWKVPFDQAAEQTIIKIINRMQGLIRGELEFNSSTNPNKCRSCRFYRFCDRRL